MNKLLTVLVALLLLLATPLPTLANPASAAKAKALVDNAVRQTKTLIAQADKAHGDEKKIKTLVKQYVTRMERLGHTGEALNDKLTEVEQKVRQRYPVERR